MRSTKRVQYVSAILVIFLFGQFAFSKLVREPYPAVILPGFSQVPDVHRQIRHEFLFLGITKAGDSIAVPTHQVFHDLIPLYHEYVLTELLRTDAREIKKIRLGDFVFVPLHRNINPENRKKFEGWLSEKISIATDRWDFEKIFLIERSYAWNEQTHRGAFLTESKVAYQYIR